MKIIVAIKQVPERDAHLTVASGGKGIDESDLSYTINEPDAYALEEALQLKEKNGGEVIALCAGPDRVASSLREALAKGADRAIHIQADNLASRDTLAVAQLLADAIRPESPDLILTGLHRTISAWVRPALSWPNCCRFRMPPSSCRWKRQTLASA